jgi:hypothetical protein
MNKGPFSWENGLGDLSGLHRLSLLKRGFFDFEIGSTLVLSTALRPTPPTTSVRRDEKGSGVLS